MRVAPAILVLSIAVVGSACSTRIYPVEGPARPQSQGIPPGHLPPPGQCRVWYDGRPPGQQPAPTSCRDAERTAARHGARVIYPQRRK